MPPVRPAAVRVVVVAANRNGTIAEIADRIFHRLDHTLPSRWTVDRIEPHDPQLGAGPAAVVLGSPVFDGRWLPSASRALERLRERPPRHLWLFSTPPGPSDDLHDVHVVPDDHRRWSDVDDWSHTIASTLIFERPDRPGSGA